MQMGSVTLEAPPEPEHVEVIGEVPGGSTLLPEAVVHSFIDKLRRTKQDQKIPADHDLAVRIPDPESGVADDVFIKDLTFARDPDNQGFLATFKKGIKNEAGEHKTRDVTVGLSVGAAIVVAGSLYFRHKK